MAFIPTRDTANAKRFYEGVPGLRFVSEDQFALVLDANGIIVRVTKVQEFKPQQFTILGWETPNIEETVSDLERSGSTSRDTVSRGKTAVGFGQRPVALKWFGSKT
jgi:hypothetical protein